MVTSRLAIPLILLMAIPAFAQNQTPAQMLRVHATVEKLDGQKLTVKTQAGQPSR